MLRLPIHERQSNPEPYHEIVSSEGKEDDQPSCSAAEALTRLEPFINQNLAYQALGMLTQLLRGGHWLTKASPAI